MAHKNQKNLSPLKSRQGKRHQKPQQIYSATEANDRLRDLFSRHGMENIGHSERQKLSEFYEILMLQQEKENFTRLLSLKDVGIKHFVDSMIVAKLCKLQFPLLDMGTGPGFPGIPLKILFPNEKIILAEGVQRRVEFLKIAREKLQLKELDIIGRNVNPWFMYPVKGVITRAVEDVRNTLLNVTSCLQTGGKVFLMKGPGVDPEIKLAEKEVGNIYKLQEDIAYTLPNTTHDRRLLIYEKIKMVPLPLIEDEPWPESELFDNQNLRFKKESEIKK